jgi:uncharacterized protein YbcC (UPF0753/DUF2309 family)
MNLEVELDHSSPAVDAADDHASPSMHGAADALDDAQLTERLRAVCGRIAPLWPLETFVAVNPYFGLADRTFADAAELLATTAGAHTTMGASYYLDALAEGRITRDDLAAALLAHKAGAGLDVDEFLAGIDHDDHAAFAPRVSTVADVASTTSGHDWTRLAVDRVSSWAAAYFDGGQAMWRSADTSLGLFEAWKEEAEIDRTPEVMGLRGFRATVRSLPDDPTQAALAAVRELGLPAEGLESYLHSVLLHLGGWSSYAARVVFERHLLGDDDDTLVQFLAVLLAWELGVHRAQRGAEFDAAWIVAAASLRTVGDQPALRGSLAERIILQDAFDCAERRRLQAQFASCPAPATTRHGAPDVQAVFCIDVRSEVFRRHLEHTSPAIDTVGFAGFFGFPIEYLPLAHDRGEAQCPVLLTPGFTVAEVAADPARTEEAANARRLSHQVRRSWKSFKMGAISCFSFVGPVGLIYLPKLFTDSTGSTRPVRRAEDEGLPQWAIDVKGPGLSTPSMSATAAGIALADRVKLAEGALRGMSLTDGFAPLVLIVGHGGATVNNPYDAGLDCGACGGHTGEANSRLAAAILNDAEVRAELAAKGIVVPDSTWFVAGQHNTTTDELTVFDKAAVPAGHRAALAQLEGHLAEAGHQARVERARRMDVAPDADLDAAVMGRSADWAQVRPEWGLAGCRAFIAAPRSRTKDLDLEGRSFLHSYDWRQDEGFGVLNLIMTAPMVVASWISLQYFASTVENERFGSGNKTLHNVVGRIGVLEGNGGDLRSGLPWQSVHDGTWLQHEPLRLNVVIEAPIDAMNDVIASNDHVRALCDNGWLSLLAMDDAGQITHRYVADLRWEPLGSPTEA